MFAHRDTREGDLVTQVAFTDVHLDLAESAPERDDALAYLGDTLGVRLARMHQVHGDAVAVVGDPDGPIPTADALVTTLRGVALLVRVADCVPVLLADSRSGVIGAVHAGRHGTALDVVGRTVAAMRDLGADGLTAWVGPHVCGRCYEVPEQMRAEVAALVPETYAETRWGTPALDLGAGVEAQLRRHGCQVLRVERCTIEHPQLHSYRRDGAASGRFGGLVWMEP